MTTEELSQLKAINREIEQKRRRLSQIEKFEKNGCANFSGAGNVKSSETSQKTLAEISLLYAQIEIELERCFKTLRQIESFIASIDDSRMRMIISLRYVNGLSWKQVAFSMGEYDEQYPRRAHNAFFKKKLAQNDKN